MRLPQSSPSAMIPVIGASMLVMACASKPPAHDPADAVRPPEEGARIVLYRECDALGLSAIRPEIRLNGARVGPAHPSSFRILDLSPGEYHLALGSGSRGMSLNLGEGDVVFVQAVVSTGSDLREGRLHSATAADAERALPTLARIDR